MSEDLHDRFDPVFDLSDLQIPTSVLSINFRNKSEKQNANQKPVTKVPQQKLREAWGEGDVGAPEHSVLHINSPLTSASLRFKSYARSVWESAGGGRGGGRLA